MIETIVGLFTTIWHILVVLFTDIYFIVIFGVLGYLTLVHWEQNLKSHSGSFKDRFLAVWTDIFSFKKTISFHNWDYERKVIGELNHTFDFLGYSAKAKCDFKNGGHKIEGVTPSKSVGFLILIWIVIKIMFVPFLCRSEDI